MGHHVTGLIARRETFVKLGGALSGQPHFALKEDFGFLPLDHENLDDLVGLDTGDAFGKFEYLTPDLIDLLREASCGVGRACAARYPRCVCCDRPRPTSRQRRLPR